MSHFPRYAPSSCSPVIGYADHSTAYILECRNTLCTHREEAEHHCNFYNQTLPLYGEKRTCPKCGFKTLEVRYYSLLENLIPEEKLKYLKKMADNLDKLNKRNSHEKI